MFTHCVFFWLKKDMTAAEISAFERRLGALTKIPSVVHGTIGKPAATDRPIIDRSYDYGLMVAFEALAGHDAYQAHPVHDEFRDEHGKHFARVQIYDFQG